MALVSDEIGEKLKKFLNMVSLSGLHIEKAIIFGSYAKGKADKWSDIDIALVSKDFTGVRKKLNRCLIKVDSSIETHPFRPEDFTRENFFVDQIVKEGIEITIPPLPGI